MEGLPIVVVEIPLPDLMDLTFFVLGGLFLLGIMSVCLGALYFLRVFLAYVRGRSIEAARAREDSRSEASEMAWLALVVGPVLGLSFGLIFLGPLVLSRTLGPWSALRDCGLITGTTAFCGAIVAGAFWTSAALMRQARKKLKRFRGAGVWDRELDGAP